MLRAISAFSSALLLTGAVLHGAARAENKLEDKLYEVKSTATKTSVGAKATTSVTIATKHGWHVNAEAPITLSLTPPAGITLPKAKLVRADLAASSQESARFVVAFEAAEAGAKVINAEARFVICQETACKPVKETLALEVEVGPAAKAPKAKGAKGKGKAKS
jgi:hypothetical protein